MTLRNINGIANLVMLAALLVAIVIGAIAIGQQGWPWWQTGLAWCLMAGGLGFVLSAAVTNSPGWDKE